MTQSGDLNSKSPKDFKMEIKFLTYREHLDENSVGVPSPMVKTIPDWYKSASKFLVDKTTDNLIIDPSTGGKVPNWKSCPSVFDVMGSGYALKTPCELHFYYNIEGRISVKAEHEAFDDFCTPRDPMDEFMVPMGYDENHFAWWIDWGVEVPEGYSVLFTHPMNRFELPFFSTSGIIDCDKLSVPGTLPFFMFKGWTGVIPAGTPYIQIIPFKRDNWESEIEVQTYDKMYNDFSEVTNKYRVPNGGVYKREVWSKRTYE